MILYRYTMRGYLILRYYFHLITRTCGFKPGRASYLVPPPEFEGSSLKASLFRHHVKQFHESSCSVATVASVINALLEKTRGPALARVTQKELLERVRTAHWKERMEPGGYKGRRGLPLDILGQVVRASLDTYGLSEAGVEIVRAKGGHAGKSAKKALERRLIRFETMGDCLILAHFDQGSYVRELNIPHISPVGGYEPKTGLVTLLDVDPSQPDPYQVSLETFYNGISTHYNHVFAPFDYGRGGYVFVRLA